VVLSEDRRSDDGNSCEELTVNARKSNMVQALRRDKVRLITRDVGQ
jgi:hypothetical protein